MSELQGTYDLKRCIFTLNERRITGFGESDAIKLTFDESNYTKKYGADGQITRTRLNARGAKLEVTLHQTNSEMIRYFESLIRLPSPLDILHAAFTDLEDGQGFLIRQCWFEKEADREWGKESSDRVYMLDTGLVLFI